MENFKFMLFSIFILVFLGFGGYWAFSTIESGSSHVDIQKQKELESDNEDLKKEILNLKKQIMVLQSDKEPVEMKDEEKIVEETPKPDVVTPKPTVIVSENQRLIDELQKLVDGNIYLKNKSQGPAVGSVQRFLNLYKNTSNKIDNDYGVTTANVVKIFQKDQGLTVDGEVGPGTLKKMISWIKAH